MKLAKARLSNRFRPFWVLVPHQFPPEVWFPPDNEFEREEFAARREDCSGAYEIARYKDAAELMVTTEATGNHRRHQALEIARAIIGELNDQNERAAVLHLKRISSLAPEESD